MQNCLRHLWTLTLCLLFVSSAFSQKSQSPGQGPGYSDSDKKKIAELEQKPEVKARIQHQWDGKRREDLQFIYRLNIDDRTHTKNDKDQDFATSVDNTGSLYNNPMLQRYINALGQRLVPKDSPNLYSFKLVLNPVPFTHAYTTGTILVSTGMVSILDNEAQLAYILGREIAHVDKNHAYELIHNQVLQDELNEGKEQQKKNLIRMFSFVGALIATQIHEDGTEWPDLYENEADDAAIHYMLDQSYDAREAPRVFVHLQTVTTKDPRVALGNAGNAIHLKARQIHLQELLSGDLRAQIEARLKTTPLTGSSGDFSLIMAALKRDNGIIAFNYDLFAIARENLQEAVDLRSNDARAQLYLGKVISITARNDQDRLEAEDHFRKAIQYDAARGAYPDPHLEHALHLIGQNGDKTEINKEIEAYIALYQRENSGSVPNNMPILYDYLTLVGNTNWYATPATVISTQNVEAVRVNTSGHIPALTGSQVVEAATRSTVVPHAQEAPDPTPTPAPPSKPRVSAKKGTAK
jgi:hypothetical protein